MCEGDVLKASVCWCVPAFEGEPACEREGSWSRVQPERAPGKDLHEQRAKEKGCHFLAPFMPGAFGAAGAAGAAAACCWGAPGAPAVA